MTEARRFVATTQRLQAHPLAAARRYLWLYRGRRFSPNEIHFLNLLDPALPRPALDGFVSKEELLGVQHELNLGSYFPWTEDKLEFHHHCTLAGLPVPAIHAVVDPDATKDGGFPRLADTAAVASFLDRCGTDELIVKPVAGVHGEGVMRLTRRAGRWRRAGGDETDAQELWRRFGQTGYSRWLFQQRVLGHPDLAALSDTDGLQTIRIVTLVEASGAVRVLAGRLRLIANGGAHDNFDFGRTGNVVANLDLESGRIRNAVGGDAQHLSMREVERHPRTGRPLLGYAVPQWQRARALAEAAAEAFKPLRTIGWDVAVTPGDPCLIEGNVTWDTLIGEPRMGSIYRDLRRLASGD